MTAPSPIKAGILGCGAIFPAYARNLTGSLNRRVQLVACADMRPEAAATCAREFGLRAADSAEALLADPAIDLVINLTPAPVHHATSLSILRAGKHLFSEKPLALTREDGRELLAEAAANGRLIGGAADTFLGAGLQWGRTLVDRGEIGEPIAAQAIIGLGMYHSERYNHVFRGALLDMGSYFLTALVSLLGPLARISGTADIRFPERPHQPEGGATFRLKEPSTTASAFTFANGTVGTLITSGDVSRYDSRLEIHGTSGTLILNDPNRYGGDVTLHRPSDSQTYRSLPGFSDSGRGLGVAELAAAIQENRRARNSGELMFHVLDAMLAIPESSSAGRHVRLESSDERPEPFDASTVVT